MFRSVSMTAAQALGCQACGGAITPCLVCAYPIAVPESQIPSNKACCKCGVLNPLGNKHRYLLGIPPTLALPSAVVRRAQVARVGRRTYTLAKHAHYMHLRSNLNDSNEGEEEDEGSELTDPTSNGTVMPTTPPVPEIYASFEEGHPITFLPYMQDMDVGMHGQSACVGRMASGTVQDPRFSDSESPLKRMSVTNPCHSQCPDLVQAKSSTGQPSSGNHTADGWMVGFFNRKLTTSPRQYERDEVEHHPNGLNPRPQQSAVPAGLHCSGYRFFEHNFDELAKLGEAAELVKRPSADMDIDAQAPQVAPLETQSLNMPKVNNNCPEAGETICSIPVNCESEGIHKTPECGVSESKQPETNSTEPYLQPSGSMPQEHKCSPETSNTNGGPFQGRQDSHGGEAGTSRIAASNDSHDAHQKYFERDFYAQTNIEESVEHAGICSQKATTSAPQTLVGEGEINNHVSKDVTGSEEVAIHRGERLCSVCGQSGGSSKWLKDAKSCEADLMRCCSQILELHCPHTLRADLHGRPIYPLCSPTLRYPQGKGCQTHVTQLSIEMLRTAHLTLISSSQESTSDEVRSPLQGLEHTLLEAEKFIKMKDDVANVRGLVHSVDDAIAQAARDVKAFVVRGAFPLASQIIPRLLNARKHERADSLKKDSGQLPSLLLEINALLSTCFHCITKVVELPSPSGGKDSYLPSMYHNLTTVKMDKNPAVETVQIAVPLWLHLYHDVAHTAGVL